MAETEWIAFTPIHEKRIRNEEKVTTMRTLKQDHFHPSGTELRTKRDEIDIEVTDVEIIEYGPDTLRNVGRPEYESHYLKLAVDETEARDIILDAPSARDELADLEGFEDAEKMLQWFEDRNYKLPQPFFLYRFTVIP